MTRLAAWVVMAVSTLIVAPLQDPKPSTSAPKATPTPSVSKPPASPGVKPTSTPAATPTPPPIDVEKLAREQVPVAGKVETWYQVFQNADPVGTAHEIITRISQAKFSYTFECDFDYNPPNQT